MEHLKYVYTNNFNRQRRKINEDNQNIQELYDNDKIKENKMNSIKNKYFNKIIKSVNKAIVNNKNQIHFYYNYYDFLNNGLGKPHGFLNEFMYEMSYEYSNYISKDLNNNPITFKSLFGNNFKWELHGKNMLIISW